MIQEGLRGENPEKSLFLGGVDKKGKVIGFGGWH